MGALKFPLRPWKPGQQPVEKDMDGVFHVRYFTREHRAWLIFAVALPRAGVTAILGWTGVIFLRQAPTYEDAILNSLALVFILGIPDIFYYGLCSNSRREFLERFHAMEFL